MARFQSSPSIVNVNIAGWMTGVLVRLTSRSFRAWDFHGGDLIKYPLCGMNFAELSACVDSAKWLSSQIIK